MDSVQIRVACEADAAALLEIYAYYVHETAVSFEYQAPTVEGFSERIKHTLLRYPYLIAQDEHENILGYAYAGPLVDRKAYDWVCETSVYLNQGIRGHGIGSMLYDELFRLLVEQNIYTAYACVARPRMNDTRLSDASFRFHMRNGFRLVGTFEKSGYKFDTWYDMVWMEKRLAEFGESVPPVIPFPQLVESRYFSSLQQ